MAHMAIKIEGQIKRRGNGGRALTEGKNQSGSKPANSFGDDPQPMRTVAGEVPPIRPINTPPITTRGRERRCFRCQGFSHIASECPNKQAMVIREDGSVEAVEIEKGAIVSEEEKREHVEEEVEVPAALVLVGSKQGVVHEERINEDQRDNLFYTRCQVNDKICSVIIDGGSCTNIASDRMVSKLALPMIDHPAPYQLQWLNNGSGVRIEKQVRVPFKIGSYEDVECDVIPMSESHLLLGRPWQYDRRVVHEGKNNTYSFLYHHHKVILRPLSPSQVREDQRQVLSDIEQGNSMKDDPATDMRSLWTSSQLTGKSITLDLRENPFEEEGDDKCKDACISTSRWWARRFIKQLVGMSIKLWFQKELRSMRSL